MRAFRRLGSNVPGSGIRVLQDSTGCFGGAGV